MIALVFVSGSHGCDTKPLESPSAAKSAPTNAADQSVKSFEFRDWPRSPPIDPAEFEIPSVRIVSGAPNITEICCALGLRELLVGRTRYCTYPPEVESVLALGGLVDGSAEALVAQKPDVVLVAGSSRALVERLTPLGFEIMSLPDRSLEDLFTTIMSLGDRFHRKRTAAALVEGIRHELNTATGLSATGRAAANGKTALFLLGTLADPPRPPFAAGPGSFFDDLLLRADLTNIVTDSLASFAPVSLEFILSKDPAFIFELDPTDERPGGDESARQAWSKLGKLRAVSSSHVRVLRGPQYFLLGPRIAQTLAEISRIAENAGPVPDASRVP